MIVIQRKYNDKQTEGILEVYNDKGEIMFLCRTLERAWLNNDNNVSCIPEGKYDFTKEIQPTRGKVLRLHNIPDRAGVLVHKGNYVYNSKGCILPGRDFVDMNKDGLLDVTSSGETMDALYDILPDKGIINIV